MLTSIRRRTNIHIYNDKNHIGFIFPSYYKIEIWNFFSDITNTHCNMFGKFETSFKYEFGFDLDNIPNIRKKMKVAYELQQSILLANKLSDSEAGDDELY